MINEILTKKFEKLIENKEILKGVVKIVQRKEDLDTDILVLDIDGIMAIIPKEEVDCEVEWKTIVGFVGREISFIIKEIDRDNGILICSRKDAQEIVKEAVVQRLQEGEVFSAQIVKLLKYGAYVEIEGVTGLLKNVDFAEDYTTIKEILKVGDFINIKLKNNQNTNKLIFEAVKKYKNPTIMNIDIFEKDQVVLGVIRNIKPDRCYVNIAPKLDALCPIPSTGEIEENMKVLFKIKQVIKEQGRVRGKIIRTV